jgi:hypothetical protein
VHLVHGVGTIPIIDHAGIGEYVSKIHLELTRQDLKTARGGSRTPWQIAADAAETGDKRTTAIWAEFCNETKGRRMMIVSPRPRAIYALACERAGPPRPLPTRLPLPGG